MSSLEIERQAREQLGDFLASVGQPPGRPPIDRSGDRPDNDGMERRLSELEKAVGKLDDGVRVLEKDVAVIKSNYATKADVQASRNTIIMWIVGAVLFAQVFPNIPGVLRALGLAP